MSIDQGSIVLPRHVAIIMDGNGRWAQQRHLPRHFGHRAGVEAVQAVVETSARLGIEILTLFAFSSENWARPVHEVGMLMDLFATTLKREVKRLCKHNVRLQVIGDRRALPEKLQRQVEQAEALTHGNDGLALLIAANYGGRWEITEAARQIVGQVERGELRREEMTPEVLERQMAFSQFPDPDLFIRTGGEQRISNFLLWQLAYTELYFTDTLWPDFDAEAFGQALESFSKRQRRFGLTGDQVRQASS